MAEIGTPIFGGYQMEVSNSIKAGDYFATKALSEDKLITVDISNGNPVYVHIYTPTASGPVLIIEGVTPVSASMLGLFAYQVHITTISPVCGSDIINKTITLECEDCATHKGVGINVTEVDQSAALHIGNNQGGLLLPSVNNLNSIPLASEGLMYYNQADKELSFFDGLDWRQALSISATSSRFDFRRTNNNNNGTDGTFISIFNPNTFGSGYTSGLRLINGSFDWDSASAIFYRNGKMHFAQKNYAFLDRITIEDSFLQMDRNSMTFTGPDSNIGMEFNINSINNESSSLYLQNTSTRDIILTSGGGKVGIAKGNPTAMLDIQQVGSQVAGLRIENNNDADDWTFEVGSNDLLIDFNGIHKASIDDIDGSWDQTSDRRLKKDIVYDQRSILNDIINLKPASYRYLDNPNDTPKSYGFIAQEVQEIFPELVNADEGKYLTISYSDFSVLAIKAIQEQQEIIEAMENKYKALLRRVEKLE